jgi:hypothetical protein
MEDTKMTHERLAEIKRMFEDEERYQLDGYGEGYSQSIDRDQAIDEERKAVYKKYCFIEINADIRHEVTAEEMEKFSETW